LEKQGVAPVIFQGGMLAAPGQGLLIKLLGPVKFPQVFIALDENIQKLQVARVLKMSLLQILHGQFDAASPFEIGGVLHQTGRVGGRAHVLISPVRGAGL
jgi:hypothetical protein